MKARNCWRPNGKRAFSRCSSAGMKSERLGSLHSIWKRSSGSFSVPRSCQRSARVSSRGMPAWTNSVRPAMSAVGMASNSARKVTNIALGMYGA